MKKFATHASILCAVLFVLLFSANAAYACSCAVGGTVDTEFEESANVAVFKLRSVEKRAADEEGYGYGEIKNARLTVEKVFKGNLKVGQELTFTQGGGADCVWTFSEEIIGMEFLFYLGAKPKDNLWTAGTCSRSNTVKGAAADLLYLEKISKVKGKTRLSGTLVQEIDSAVEEIDPEYKRLAGRKVVITSAGGGGKKIELKTDENGVYEIYDLPAGKYRVSTESIAGYKFTDEKKDWTEVEVKAKSHSENNFRFVIDNAIRGRLFDANGKTLESVCLDLIPARGKKSRYFYEADCTDAKGNFEFEEIPAGTYLIVVNEENEISSRQPFGTFYYPSATRREDAAEINIGAGDFFENLVINAPQTAEVILVTGVLLFEDNKPAADEFVEFFVQSAAADSKPPGEYTEPDARAKTDAKGQFSIRILKGQKGQLLGKMITYEGEFENCPKLDKLIREKEIRVGDVETPAVEIEATRDQSGIELRFPFPKCKKAKID